jgi:hypothetical protein
VIFLLFISIGHKTSTIAIAGYPAILKEAVTITSTDAVMPIVGISAMLNIKLLREC